MVSVRRKGVTNLLKRWNEPVVNHISAEIFLPSVWAMLA
jgi:hypothetical protein